MTAASLGPSLTTPVRGLTTLPPWTSWSYWRTTDSLLQMLRRESIAFRAPPRSGGSGKSGSGWRGGVQTARRFICGRPSWRKDISIRRRSLPRSGCGTSPNPYSGRARSPRTSIFRARQRNSSIFAGSTARVIRSWDSEMRISQGFSPGYFSGAFFRSSSQPPERRAVSPTEEERPPAPLSVIAR